VARAVEDGSGVYVAVKVWLGVGVCVAEGMAATTEGLPAFNHTAMNNPTAATIPIIPP